VAVCAFPGRESVMSVLERFVRIRSLRVRAAAYYALASDPYSANVHARYLTIADHYIALAEADKLECQQRLEELRAKRALAVRPQSAHRSPPETPKAVKLRLIQGDGAGADKRQLPFTSRGSALADIRC
jgi:hypothetical protein